MNAGWALGLVTGLLYGIAAGMWVMRLAARRHRRRVVLERLGHAAQRTDPGSGVVLVTSRNLSAPDAARFKAEFRARMLARHPECPVCNPTPDAPAGTS